MARKCAIVHCSAPKYITNGVVCNACRLEKYISSSWINFNTLHLTIIAQSHDEILSLTRSIAHIFSNV